MVDCKTKRSCLEDDVNSIDGISIVDLSVDELNFGVGTSEAFVTIREGNDDTREGAVCALLKSVFGFNVCAPLALGAVTVVEDGSGLDLVQVDTGVVVIKRSVGVESVTNLDVVDACPAT